MFAKNELKSNNTLLNISTSVGNNADEILFDTLKVLFPDYQKLCEN